MYRMVLYSDDFSPFKSLHKKGSVGGCYMMPLWIPPEYKFSVSSLRCISLTSLDVTSSVIMSAIVPDLIRGATQGFPVRLPNGDDVVLFLDFVTFVADYPAAAKMVHHFGVNALAPCTHCTFKKYTKDPTTPSPFGHSTQPKYHGGTYITTSSRVV